MIKKANLIYVGIVTIASLIFAFLSLKSLPIQVGLIMPLAMFIGSIVLIAKFSRNSTGRRTGTSEQRNYLYFALVLFIGARLVKFFTNTEYLPYSAVIIIAIFFMIVVLGFVGKFANQKKYVARHIYLVFFMLLAAVASFFLMIKGIDSTIEGFLIAIGEIMSVWLLVICLNRHGNVSNLNFRLCNLGALLLISSNLLNTILFFGLSITLPKVPLLFLECFLFYPGLALLILGVIQQIIDKIENVKFFTDQKEENPMKY